jgi:hypothetical protein
MLVRVQPPQQLAIGDNMKAYDFTFTLRAYGTDPDVAFNALTEVLDDNLSLLFTNVVDYEMVPEEEAEDEITVMIEHAIEEVVCSLPEGEA